MFIRYSATLKSKENKPGQNQVAAKPKSSDDLFGLTVGGGGGGDADLIGIGGSGGGATVTSSAR